MQSPDGRKRVAMDLNAFAPEQIEKAKTCKTAQGLIELANAEGAELTDEQEGAHHGEGLQDHTFASSAVLLVRGRQLHGVLRGYWQCHGGPALHIWGSRPHQDAALAL